MVLIFGCVLGLATLYAWLIGHWFGRALAFLAFLPLFGMAGVSVGEYILPKAPDGLRFILCPLLGLALAWPVSGIPIYYRRAAASKATA